MNISKSLDYLHCLSFGALGKKTSIYDPIKTRHKATIPLRFIAVSELDHHMPTQKSNRQVE